MAKKMTAAVEGSKLQLNLVNTKGLIDFLQKFKTIDQNILISINSETIDVRTVTPTEVAVKAGQVSFDDVFILPEGETIPENLKIGIYNIDKFVKTFSYLDEDNIMFNISYKYDSTDNFAYKVELKTASLQKIFPTAGKKIYRSLTDEQMERAFNTDDAYFKIVFDKPLINKVNNLLSLETSKFFNLVYKKGTLTFEGKEFKLKYNGELEVLSEDDFTMPLEKGVFKYADNEIYELYAREEGIMLFGMETEMKIAIAAIENPDELENSTQE